MEKCSSLARGVPTPVGADQCFKFHFLSGGNVRGETAAAFGVWGETTLKKFRAPSARELDDFPCIFPIYGVFLTSQRIWVK